MSYKIPQIYLDACKDELALLKDVINSKWLTEGKYTNKFTDKIIRFNQLFLQTLGFESHIMNGLFLL